jgi:AraC family transcriptional regulator of arabinose operon
VLSSFRRLPRRSFGLSLVRSYLEHRCDLRSIGYSRETDSETYRFDNANRGRGWLFQYTLEGRGHFFDGDAGAEHVLVPGEGFLAPLTSHTRYWLAPAEEWEFVYVIFSGEQAEYHARRLLDAWGYVCELPMRSAPVRALYETYRAMVDGRTPDEYVASAALYRFLMEFSSIRHTARETVPPQLERARRHIKEHFARGDLGIDELAEVAGFSRYHFTRLFKRHVGMAPYAYLLRLRLSRATERIGSSKDPIKQIALEVGFNDYAYFCNVFKKYAGSTPAGMRRSLTEMGATDVLTG